MDGEIPPEILARSQTRLPLYALLEVEADQAVNAVGEDLIVHSLKVQGLALKLKGRGYG